MRATILALVVVFGMAIGGLHTQAQPVYWSPLMCRYACSLALHMRPGPQADWLFGLMGQYCDPSRPSCPRMFYWPVPK